MKTTRLALCGLMLFFPLLLAGSAAAAPGRLALVIGNSAYQDAPLKNPVNDANGMAEALQDLGFEVMLHTDLNLQGTHRAVRDFGKKLRDSRGVGLFYYAGHGIQIKGTNYIVPVGAEIETEDEVRFEAFQVDRVLAKMQAAESHLNIVLLDSCRNNPFARSFRSVEQGLARMDAPTGTFIAYATKPDSVAADGPADNGVFTGALLRHIRKPGLSLSEIMRLTRVDVLKQTNQAQIPWDSSSITAEFYFSRPDAAPQVALHETDAGDSAGESKLRSIEDLEQIYWNECTGNDVASYCEAYVQKFPNGRYIFLAEARIRELNRLYQANDPLEGQLETCKAHYAANNLMQGAGGNALDCYRQVLEQDPANVEAVQGIQSIATRYLQWAGTMLEHGDKEAAKAYLAKAKSVSPEHPLALDLERRLSGKAPLKLVARPRATPRPGLVAVPQGCFGLENPDDPADSRELCLDGFDISQTEITNRQFAAFLDDVRSNLVLDANGDSVHYRGYLVFDFYCGDRRGGCEGLVEGIERLPDGRIRAVAGREDYPVVLVSWHGAAAYAGWLSNATGQAYRLPTEAEWEYAARAGTSTAYWWGDAAPSCANRAGVGARFRDGDCGSGPASVQDYRSNPWGLFDTAGNVAEWTCSRLTETYDGSEQRCASPDQAEDRVFRGGSWLDEAGDITASYRIGTQPDYRAQWLGFRIVKTRQ